MLADTFAITVNWGYSNFETATSMDWILVMLFYTFEIYFDFSGYTDMAVGMHSSEPIHLTDDEKNIVIENVQQNIT